MNKKSKTKANRGKTKAAKKPEDLSSSQTTSAEPENPFDFGGLPKRDLKKNLGCG